MPVEGWLYFIVSFMIFASIIALELKDLLSSVVSVGVTGLALAVAFIFLQAPDLALVQFVYEIISVIILIMLLKATGEKTRKRKGRQIIAELQIAVFSPYIDHGNSSLLCLARVWKTAS